MEFLRQCASRLDDGCPAESVLRDMEKRYHTVRCLNVKTCLVRQMCRPTDEYRGALTSLCEEHNDIQEQLNNEDRSCERVCALLRTLPPKWCENVKNLKVSRAKMIQCKRLGIKSAIEKNKKRVRVDGVTLLAKARYILDRCCEYRLSTVAFALMLVTGRRTCEIMNGRSTFERIEGETFAIRFGGVAKRRGRFVTIDIPILSPVDTVLLALEHLRCRQKKITLSNKEVSRRYQSLFARDLSACDDWRQCRRVHGLRGIYVCMSLKLFIWSGDPADAYVAMCILGHTGLHESLVYTTYHLGDDFKSESVLGEGRFTHSSNEVRGIETDVVEEVL